MSPDPPQPARYTCYRAAGPLVIDGRLDEPSWLAAPKSSRFVDIVTGDPAWYDTHVALLWDDSYLYFGFTAEEPNVSATFTERDSRIYEDNDLEVFIAGPDAYYEFEINSLNTIYEVFWIWKALRPGSPYNDVPEFDPFRQRTLTLSGVGGHLHARGPRWGFLDWDFPGLRHAVQVGRSVDGLDGWTVELAFPWAGLGPLSDGRQLPPLEGDVWRIDCSRFQQLDRSGRAIPPGAGWTWNRHGHYDSHIPELFPYVRFSTDPVTVTD